MAGTQQTSSRISIVTDAHAKPTNAREHEVASQLVATALQGAWGKGSWDGGSGENWVPGVGNWEKHSESWDATLQTTLSGSAVVTFPFTVVRGIVKLYKISDDRTVSMHANYIESGKTLSIEHIGLIVIELTNIKNIKEVSLWV